MLLHFCMFWLIEKIGTHQVVAWQTLTDDSFSEVPMEFMDAALIRQGDHWSNLGLFVSPDDNPIFLTIDKIVDESLFGMWNSRYAEAEKVAKGDVIIRVNGATGETMKPTMCDKNITDITKNTYTYSIDFG